MAPDSSLMTVKEMAAMLRVSPQTLYKMLEQGEIPAVKVGSQWRFDREKIKDWIEGRAQVSTVAKTPANGKP